MKTMSEKEYAVIGQNGTYYLGRRRTILAIATGKMTTARIDDTAPIEVWRHINKADVTPVKCDNSFTVERPASKPSYTDLVENIIPQLMLGLGF